MGDSRGRARVLPHGRNDREDSGGQVMPWVFIGIGVIWLFSWVIENKRDAEDQKKEQIDYWVKK